MNLNKSEIEDIISDEIKDKEFIINKNIIDDFFIKCISVNAVNVKASYYPENCNYLGLMGGNIIELHKITNYQNIDLQLKILQYAFYNTIYYHYYRNPY